MSPKILKSLPSGSHQRFQFHEFEGSQDDLKIFEGNTVNLVEPPSLDDIPPVQDFQPPQVDIETIIRKAEQDAERIRKGAREEAGRLEREAYEKGIAEGQKTGELMAQQKLDAMLFRYDTSLRNLMELRELALKDLTFDIIDLVVFVAEKVIHNHIQAHPSTVVEMVREAIHSVKEKEQMVVFLNPDDFTFIKNQDEHLRRAGLGGSVRLEQDSQLSRGSIRIKTSYGDVDGSIETQLDLIRKAVQEKLLD